MELPNKIELADVDYRILGKFKDGKYHFDIRQDTDLCELYTTYVVLPEMIGLCIAHDFKRRYTKYTWTSTHIDIIDFLTEYWD